MFLICIGAKAQNNSLSNLTLESYRIPINQKGAEIASIKLVGTSDKIYLSKDTANIFQIDEFGKLSLKPNISLETQSPMVYQIELSTPTQSKTFELVKDEFLKNKIIAHRGAWKNQDASQNSILSLKKAIEIGCEAVEFDVWLSSDNRVILSHDPSIGGKFLEETPSWQLMRIPLKNGDYVPCLEEYIEEIKKQNKTHLVLEIKKSQKGTERSCQLADSAVKIVQQMQAQAWVEYISFDLDVLIRIKQIDPTARVSYLESDKTIDELADLRIDGIDYHFSNFENSINLIKNAHDGGLSTNAWTVNDINKAELLLKQGIDYLTTDEPELLLKIKTK